MSQIKEKVRNYLQTDRSLSGGVVLYQSLPGRNMALAASYGKMNDTENNRKEVCYELCKLAGIPHGEMNSLLAQRIEAKQESMEETDVTQSVTHKPDVSKGDSKSENTGDKFDSMKWNDIRKAAADLPEEFAPAGKSKDELLAALRAHDAHFESEKKKAKSYLQEMLDKE